MIGSDGHLRMMIAQLSDIFGDLLVPFEFMGGGAPAAVFLLLLLAGNRAGRGHRWVYPAAYYAVLLGLWAGPAIWGWFVGVRYPRGERIVCGLELLSVVGGPILATLLFLIGRRYSRPGHCPECGYDLTGNVSGRCPECGGLVATEDAGELPEDTGDLPEDTGEFPEDAG